MHAPLLDQPSRQEILTILHTRFSHRRFRPGQEDVLEALLTGQDVLAVLPTGAGKSLIFQIASQVLPGITIVVSPLLALMHDQEESLEDLGVGVAVLNSTLTEAQAESELARVVAGDARLLYVTPERLVNEQFVREIARMPISLVAVDEAHCASEWGHDFRPAYLALGATIRQLGQPTILALTATATPWVRQDITAMLGMREPQVIVRGSDRPNLFLEVHRVETETDEHRALRRLLAPSIDDHHQPLAYADGATDLFQGAGIIYTATTRAARETAEWLQSWGVNADYYHGQRSKRDRVQVQDAFMDGKIRVVAATNAFGLGIDKPDVRFVLHRDIPASLEAYYQEAGRAGRDGDPALALLLYRPADLGRAAFLSASGRLDEQHLTTICATLREHGDLTPAKLRNLTGLPQPTQLRALAALMDAGVVGKKRNRLHLLQPECDLASISLEAEERRRAYESSRLAMMRGYAETTACRREYILNYFGESFDPPSCRRCDNSVTGSVTSRPTTEGPFHLGEAVRHERWGDGLVERITVDTVTVLFDRAGFKTLDLALVEERQLLQAVGSGVLTAQQREDVA